MNHPKVSVIIPVYNGESFIRDSINSVISQSYDNWECIVVDDGSTDESASIIKSFDQVVCVQQEHQCVAAARNSGVRQASGDYLAFLDADDIWDLDKLNIQVDFMEKNLEVDYSVTRHSIFLDHELKELPAWVRTERQEAETTAYIPSALLVRRSVFDAVGGFDETYRIGDDSDWFLRARDAGFRVGIVEKNLLYKRVHSRCLTSQTEICRKELLKSIKASLKRTRSSDTISVIIPVYNGEKYLREAVDSALNQSLTPFEVLIVDDGSTDKTGQIAKGYQGKVRYIRRDIRGGAAAARNDGVKNAAGDYLAFLDADDFWDKDKLARQLREIKKPNSAGMIFGMVTHFFSPETHDDFRNQFTCPEQPLQGLAPGTILIRRDEFMKVGYFSEQYKTGEFIEWYQRAVEAGLTLFVLPEVLMHRRIHPLNHGIVEKNRKDDYARIVREIIMRRREKNKDDSKA